MSSLFGNAKRKIDSKLNSPIRSHANFKVNSSVLGLLNSSNGSIPHSNENISNKPSSLFFQRVDNLDTRLFFSVQPD
jgi:hypothetical protein